MRNLLIGLSFVFLMIATAGVDAADKNNDGTLTVSGFYSLTGAKLLSDATRDTSNSSLYQNHSCPCNIAVYEYGGVYEKDRGIRFDQESLLGIQIRKKFSPTLSATAQLVSRLRNPNDGSTPTIDWLYVTWQPSGNSGWMLQVGKMRIPIYYYSDQLYVGYAYPWVRPSADVYGTSIYSYNGINASYRTQLGTSDWASTITAWSGSYTQKDDVYLTRLFFGQPTNEAWKRMLGGSVAVTNDVFDIRATMMHMNDIVWRDRAGGAPSTTIVDKYSQFAGLSMNMDYKNFLIKSEIDRADVSVGKYKYGLLGIGYQLGAWTPMYTYSR